MKLLYCDETNLEEKSGTFLIYGGIIIDGNNARELSHEINDLRKRHRVPREYILKFNPGPSRMPHHDFIALKRELIATALKFDSRFLAYAILHDISKGPAKARERLINWFPMALAVDATVGMN